MNHLLAIAAGGALGAMGRYGVSQGVHSVLGRGFPYGTLTANVLGSLLIGVLFVFLVERIDASPEWRAFLVVGFLGAFTTFSSFSLETMNLLTQGEAGKAMLNVVLSVSLCLVATWAGILLARQF
ncbi:MAG: fluoride efflux transporter CrcB [Gammaproteobacteria bacterium]|nr:fluoride efflux transporter CrcB [Gammaproteobacteria bacterium]